ncbi:MAG: hypothetical protein F9K23_00870 [Bacteroidetes bacterium]|nr:MAG: hypothetical protein F9K23_00870 [Bacteroidota bacterium]
MNGPYEIYDNEYGVRISYLLTDDDRRHTHSVGLFSYDVYLKRAYRKKDFRLKQGRGYGNEALVRFNALTNEEQQVLVQKWGSPKQTAHPLQAHYELDGAARAHYDRYVFDDGQFIKEEQKLRYTVNASVLNALAKVKAKRLTERKKKHGSTRIWDTLIKDVHTFNEVLREKYGYVHSLPNSDKLRHKLNDYLKNGYDTLIPGYHKNSNAQLATPLMIELWTNIYAGQKGKKPNYTEVWATYNRFLQGQLDIINNATKTPYDYNHPDFKVVSDKTVYRYQTMWEVNIGATSKREGNDQVFKKMVPHHQRYRPMFAGTLISVDDRQPKFEYAPGKRIWAYMGIDVGSTAFTTWVFGASKKGIITEFYKEMCRAYERYGKHLPYEMEGERSLNSSFETTFLQNGAMFQRVRIEANNARGKVIERYFRDFALMMERQVPGFKARPFARTDAHRPGREKQIYYTQQEIVQIVLRAIKDWNNMPHPNQELHPAMTRWDVFNKKQHPELEKYPTNWAGLLPHLGKVVETSMEAGYIRLQHKQRKVGFDGKVAIGTDLINIMRQIEGKKVLVRWLDDAKGNVLKALVYTPDNKLVCELINETAYNHGALERTAADDEVLIINSAYQNTVTAFYKTAAKRIDSVTIIDNEPLTGSFDIPELQTYHFEDTEAEELPLFDEEEQMAFVPANNTLKTDFISRF